MNSTQVLNKIMQQKSKKNLSSDTDVTFELCEILSYDKGTYTIQLLNSVNIISDVPCLLSNPYQKCVIPNNSTALALFTNHNKPIILGGISNIISPSNSSSTEMNDGTKVSLKEGNVKLEASRQGYIDLNKDILINSFKSIINNSLGKLEESGEVNGRVFSKELVFQDRTNEPVIKEIKGDVGDCYYTLDIGDFFKLKIYKNGDLKLSIKECIISIKESEINISCKKLTVNGAEIDDKRLPKRNVYRKNKCNKHYRIQPRRRKRFN